MVWWAYIIVACLANAAFRALVLKDPILPLFPPRTALNARLRALFFQSNHGMPLRPRMYMITRYSLQLLQQGIYSALFTIDDIIFAGYRACSMTNSVFIVGGFRTGSTTLHRVLALDEERYVSPRFLELTMPFLSFHYFLDFIEWLDGRIGTNMTAAIERALQAAAGPDVMARHPMALKVAEECDVLLATCHWSGYYAITLAPTSGEAWEAFGGIESFSQHEKAHIVALYTRAMQKVLYRRGNGRSLLSKSHLIDCMPLWRDAFKGAKFVGIVRHPRDVVTSWVALAQPAAEMLTGHRMPLLGAAVPAHMSFWDTYLAKERKFFVEGAAAADPSRVFLRFKPFIKNQLETMKGLYTSWGWKYEGTPFERRLEAQQANTRAYKSAHSYANPTLSDLGLTDEMVCERFGTYIAAMGLEEAPKSK